jgi:hypothetical protein
MQLLLFVALHRITAGVVPTVAGVNATSVLKSRGSSQNFHEHPPDGRKAPQNRGLRSIGSLAKRVLE